jgi:hypothetical protein
MIILGSQAVLRILKVREEVGQCFERGRERKRRDLKC